MELLREHVDEEGASILLHIFSTGRHVTEIAEITRDLAETMGGGGVETHPMSLISVVGRERGIRRRPAVNHELAVGDETPDVVVRMSPFIVLVLRNPLDNAVQYDIVRHNAVRHSAIQHNIGDIVVIVLAVVDDGIGVAVIHIADDDSGIPSVRKSVIFGKGREDSRAPGSTSDSTSPINWSTRSAARLASRTTNPWVRPPLSRSCPR